MRIKPYNKSKTWLAVRKKLARSAKKGCLPHSGKDLIRLLPQHFAHWGSALGTDLRLNSLNSHPLVLLHPDPSRKNFMKMPKTDTNRLPLLRSDLKGAADA
jgi:hypothetical protein